MLSWSFMSYSLRHKNLVPVSEEEALCYVAGMHT